MSAKRYAAVSDLDLLQELERVDAALNTAKQLSMKWAQTYATLKTEAESVRREIHCRRLNQRPVVKVEDLAAGAVFEGSVRGEHFTLRVDGFSTDHRAVRLVGENEDLVQARGWAKCDQVKVARVLEVGA